MKPNSCACYGSNQIHECYCNNQNNMKQFTAVEWLQAEIDNKDMGEIPMWVYEFIEQAKAIEKQQIEDAHEIGYINGGNHKNVNGEQYYNETYKEKI